MYSYAISTTYIKESIRSELGGRGERGGLGGPVCWHCSFMSIMSIIVFGSDFRLVGGGNAEKYIFSSPKIWLTICCYYSTGELMTTATWIRNFVTTHPHYKKDSVVTEEMTYDLVKRMQEISEGGEPCTELTGKLLSKTPEIYKVIDK